MDSENSSSYSLDRAGANFYAALQEVEPSAAEMEAQRKEFANSVDRALATYPNPDQKTALMIAAGMFEWLQFGDVGESLPPGLIKVMDDQTKTIRVSIDSRIISRRDLSNAQDAFFPDDDSLLGKIGSYDKIDTDRLRSQLEEVIRKTEGYKIVQSCTVASPQFPARGPLPHWQKVVREAQIDAEIRRQYCIPKGVPIPRRSLPDYSRRRALFHLDEETVRHEHSRPSGPDDRLAKLRNYFSPIIRNLLQEKMRYGETVTHFILDTDNDYAAYENDRELGGYYIYSSDSYLRPHYRTLRMPGQYELDALFEAAYLKEVCNHAFTGQFENYSYDEAYSCVIQDILDLADDALGENPFDFFDNSGLGWLTIHAFLRQTPGPVVYESQVDAYPNAESRLVQSGVQFLGENELRELEARTIGYVRRYYAARYSPARLIQTVKQTPELPTSLAEAELILSLWLDQGEEPFIPGFIVTGQDPGTDRWSFITDPEGDPYADADVELPLEGLQALIDAYAKLGLRKLVADLQDLAKPTVADLTRFIAANTAYVVPIETQMEYHQPFLEEFISFVQNGELALQCTGSAVFLMRSLESAFGQGCATVQSGYVLPSDCSIITAAAHAQVAFVYQKQLYILDATGGGRADGKGYSPRTYLGRGARQNPRPAPRNHRTPMQSEQPFLPPVVQEEFSEEKLETNKHTFEQQLANVLGCVDTQQVYERVAMLSEDDPLRRTMSVLLDPHAQQEDLRRTLDYLEGIQNADNEILRRIGLSHYKDNLDVLALAYAALDTALRIKDSTL